MVIQDRHTGWLFHWPPNFSTKKKTTKQPITAIVRVLNPVTKKGHDWSWPWWFSFCYWSEKPPCVKEISLYNLTSMSDLQNISYHTKSKKVLNCQIRLVEGVVSDLENIPPIYRLLRFFSTSLTFRNSGLVTWSQGKAEVGACPEKKIRRPATRSCIVTSID